MKMARVYLGEHTRNTEQTPYAGFNAAQWAITFIERYGQIDSSHHKAWVLDQVARILHGTPVVVSLAQWSDGHQEYRFRTGEPSPKYAAWVESMLQIDPETGELEYDYDKGVAP